MLLFFLSPLIIVCIRYSLDEYGGYEVFIHVNECWHTEVFTYSMHQYWGIHWMHTEALWYSGNCWRFQRYLHTAYRTSRIFLKSNKINYEISWWAIPNLLIFQRNWQFKHILQFKQTGSRIDKLNLFKLGSNKSI